MNALLLLLAPVSPAQAPQHAPVAVEVAPMPAVAPGAKQLGAWLADLSHEDGERRRAALAALVNAGPRARALVPELAKHLQPDDRLLGDSLDVLAAIGPDAKDAVPALVGMLKPRDMSYLGSRLAHTVASIDGPKPEATLTLLLSTGKCTPNMLEQSNYLRDYPAQVVPHLVALCGDKDASIREKAAAVLGVLDRPRSCKGDIRPLIVIAGDGARGVPAALEKLLADESPAVRMAAAAAISPVAPQLTEKAIPVVVTTFTDPGLAEKAGQHHAAGILRPVPDAAAKALIPLFDSADDNVRTWAINTLSALPVREQMGEVLKSGKTVRSREAAAVALGWSFSDSAGALPVLKQGLADRDFTVRFAAAQGLVRLDRRGGEWALAAVPVLIDGLKQPGGEVRTEASRNLIEVGKVAKAAVPELKPLLSDPHTGAAREAALALVEIAPADAAGAVPVLAGSVRSGTDREAVRAARALCKLGALAKDAVPALVRRFDAKDVGLRLAAAEAVARIDPAQADRATGVIVGLLKAPKPKAMVLHDAAQALARIGPPAKGALPTLLELMKDDDQFPAAMAVAAILIDPGENNPARAWVRDEITKNGPEVDEITDLVTDLGPAARPFVRELVLLLESKSAGRRVYAAEALGEIGPDAEDALPALKNVAARDQRPDVRGKAATAVRLIERK
jgi:HEAT repeat protein